MDDLFKQLLRELGNIWRYRWTAALVAWLLAMVGWAVVLVLPDEYEARAQVVLDADSLARRALDKMVVGADAGSRVELVRRTMLTRTTLEQVARETDLDLRAGSPSEFERLIFDLQQTIMIEDASVGNRRGGGGDRIYTISYRDRSRQTAESVVQKLLNTMVEDSIITGSDETRQTVKFFEARVAEYGQRLNEKEQEKAEFKREYRGVLPSEGGDYFARLQREVDKLGALRGDLSSARSRRDALRAKFETTTPASEDDEGQITSPRAELDRQIIEQESRLSQLLLVYTEKHPDVLATRETLASLRDRRDAFEEESDSGGPVSALVYENLQIALNQAEVEVATLQDQVARGEAKVAALQQKLDTIPEVEARYSKLVRDYDVMQAQYDQMLVRLERMKNELIIGETGVDMNFQVIEAPRAALEPVAPDRPMLLFAALGLAIGGGLGLAWLRSQVHPVFVSRRDLYEELSRPVLGAVTMAWTPRQIALKRTESLTVITTGLMLLVAFGVVFFVQEPVSRVAQRLVW